MTRDEFLEEVNSWEELLCFCSDIGCEICIDIYDDYSRDERVDEWLYDWVREYGWVEIRNKLADIPDGDGYFLLDDWGEWSELGDYDFDEYKDRVLEWADDNGGFEADEEEADEEVPPEPVEECVEDEFEIEDEDFSFDELFLSSNDAIQKISISSVDWTDEPMETLFTF